jgi:uncharacterized tellurite resistance protein B-like protein
MATLTITPYLPNSTEAMLRVITLFIISDGEVRTAELDTLARLGILSALGADQEQFARVIAQYCDDLLVYAGNAQRVGLADPAWVDAVLASVTDLQKRRLLAQTLLVVARSDGSFADVELAVVRRLLDRWSLTLDSLTQG